MKEIQHTTKQTAHVVDVPNLVELQLDSYRWFLEEGLNELFDSFSPITDFTGNHSIELVDFTLGEPKYDLMECRARRRHSCVPDQGARPPLVQWQRGH